MSRFLSYLPIENSSKRPGASLRRKLKSPSFWTVKMRSKVHTCQSETVPLIPTFWLDIVNQRLKRRHTAPAFHTFFYQVFGLVRNQREFPFCLIYFNPRTYFVRPKTCYCQQKSSQYPIFPSQAQDQSFTRVTRNETKYKKILDAADFARRENCSFIRLNDAFRKTLLKAAKKNSKTTHYEGRVQSNTRADFKLRYRENYGKLWKTFFWGGGWG